MAEIIDFRRYEIYEAGALLVAIIAYPNEQDTERRHALFTALCAQAIRARCELDSDWASRPRWIKPAHAALSDKAIQRGLKGLERRMHERMIAGKMAIAFLYEAEVGSLPPLPSGVKHLSLNQLSAMVAEEARQSEPENLETRFWRPSRPVVHLAAATQIVMAKMKDSQWGEVNIADFFTSQALIEEIVYTAERFETLFDKSRAPVKSVDLIQVRIAA
jgi:hypothetical protein